MVNKWSFRTLILTALLASSAVVQAWWWTTDNQESNQQALALDWEDLLPDDFKPPIDPLREMSKDQIDKLFDGSDESKKEIERLEEMLAYAPTVESLNGTLVKIPGYVVPLDFDGQSQMKEFLIVPYFGACIHSPPPPANQVVHANSSKMVVVEDLYSPVWAIGVLTSQTSSSNLAEAGYQLELHKLVPYEE